MMIDVIALAHRVGRPVGMGHYKLSNNSEILAFAQLVQQATVEECVNACKDERDMIFKEYPDQPTIDFRLCIAAIRAKFAKEETK